MSPVEIDNRNEKIASFLGWFKQFDDLPTWFVRDGFGIYVACSSTRDMKFHKSMDALLPVIEKIGLLDPDRSVTHMYQTEINGNGTTIYKTIHSGNETGIITRHNSTNNWINNTWRCCLDFIDWHEEKTMRENGEII